MSRSLLFLFAAILTATAADPARLHATPALESRNALPGGWGTVLDPDGASDFRVKGKELTIELPGIGTDFDPARAMNAPRALTEVEGDFAVQVTVHGKIHPVGHSRYHPPWQSAGLIVHEPNERRWARLEHGAYDDYGRKHHRVLSMVQQVRGAWAADWIDGWQVEKPIWLRFERRGSRLRGSFSFDGKVWTNRRRFELNDWPAKVRVGVIANNTVSLPLVAKLSDFALTTTLPPAGSGLSLPPLPDAASELPGGWGRGVDPEKAATFSASSGELIIDLKTVQTDLWESRVNAPRALTEVEGEFTATVRVDPVPAPAVSSRWNSAGLVVMIDERNLFRLDRGMWSGDKDRPDVRVVHDLLIQGYRDYRSENPWLKPDPAAPLWMRVERRGHQLLAAISTDAKTWTELKPQDISEWPQKLRVGVVAMSSAAQPFPARFFDFTLTTGGAAR